jgi:hypothetical protein
MGAADNLGKSAHGLRPEAGERIEGLAREAFGCEQCGLSAGKAFVFQFAQGAGFTAGVIVVLCVISLAIAWVLS